MNCPHCLAETSPEAKFCGKCGTKLDNVIGAATPETAGAPTPAAPTPEASCYTAAAPADEPRYATATPYGAPQQAPTGAVPGGADRSQGVQAQALRGCLGEAWHDITSSPGWVKRVLLLMVMNCVPVLNFFAQGYNLQWGAEAACGRAGALPRGAFGKKTFLAGLLFMVINLLGGIAGVVLLAFNLIPFVGFIVVGIGNLLISTFVALAAMRMMVYRSFGEAFELSSLFTKFKGGLGSLFAAACVPGIIAGVLVFLVMVLVMAVMVIASMAGTPAGYCGYGASSLIYGFGYHGYDPVGTAVALLSMFGGVTLLIFVLALFSYGFADLWSTRAVGHWVARNAPEWAEEERDSQGVLS